MFDIILNSVRVMFRKRGRTMLTLFGIVIGVSSVIIINVISRCGNSALTNEVDTLGMGGLSITQSKPSAPLAKKELNIIQDMPFVDFAMPLMFESTEVTVHDYNTPVFVWGIDKNAKDVINISIVNGRYLNSGDISSFAQNCMIDQTLAQSCYGTEKVSGKKITISCSGVSSEYTIVGVIKTGSGILQNMMGGFIPNFVYLPYTTMQNNAGTGNYTQIEVKLKPDHDYDAAGKDIVRRMERGGDLKGAYTVTNLARQKEGISNIIDIFTAVLTCVGVISLIVAGLNIMNVMLVSVNERTREIGIKKALGASKADIVIEFLIEALILTLTGCIIGVVSGLLVSWAGTALFGLTFAPEIDIILLVFIFSAFIGAVFGIYPALKAARLDPVTALRTF